MKITPRLILSFLLVSVLPLAVIGYAGLRAMSYISSLAADESTAALTQLGEASIQQKALDVARQVDLYLQANPQFLALSPAEWSADSELFAIGVQPVGKTGYTAVYDSRGIVYLHANPKMIGRNMQELAADFPAFWAIYEASLDGTKVASYYDWMDADGVIRDKYMSCVPVGDTFLRVAATTYIDEFSQPMREIAVKIDAIYNRAYRYILIALVLMGGLAIGLGLWLALGISRPILVITDAAKTVERGGFETGHLDNVARRTDELGQLADTFQRMARQVYAREQQLKQQVQELRIEIDEVKQQRQVAEITETEYFHNLMEKIKQLKMRQRQ
jgi:HAMP domain-containing protein